MANVLISTTPFASQDSAPLDSLADLGVHVIMNPLGRRLTADELTHLIPDIDVLIAGTEPITAQVLDAATKLRLISRVGIGLDNVDLVAARDRGIQVSYTPDAPAPAVAELTIGLALSLLRGVQRANVDLHVGRWNRHMGRRLAEVTFGIVGVGRIGSRVIDHLSGFGPPTILACDIRQADIEMSNSSVHWVDRDYLFRNADVVSLHVPLTSATRHLVSKKQLMTMKPDALLINTARGGIVHEQDLFEALSGGHLGGAAIDVFEQEPYQGPLGTLPCALLTCHMGSMTSDCRAQMEIEATNEVVRYFQRRPLEGLVPEAEYEEQTRL